MVLYVLLVVLYGLYSPVWSCRVLHGLVLCGPYQSNIVLYNLVQGVPKYETGFLLNIVATKQRILKYFFFS